MNETQETTPAESQPAQDAEPSISPSRGGAAARMGLLLRKAREARGLSVDDVVQSLKFSHRQIEALESDDLASLPGSVFVRGSVRSYARFLKLDPEPLLAMLAAENPVVQPEVRPPDNMGDAMTPGVVRQISPLVALSVLLLIVAAGMVAWHFLGVLPREASPPPATEAVADTAREAMPPVSSPSAPIEAQPAQSPPMTALAPVDVQPASVPAPAQATQTPLSADARTLQFAFRGRCWVEVKDASQLVIFTGQFEQGATRSVSGQPPFQVVLGNSANVDLVYEGQPVDLKPHTRAEVARLTLE